MRARVNDENAVYRITGAQKKPTSIGHPPAEACGDSVAGKRMLFNQTSSRTPNPESHRNVCRAAVKIQPVRIRSHAAGVNVEISIGMFVMTVLQPTRECRAHELAAK
jgi:hypothetical protein